MMKKTHSKIITPLLFLLLIASSCTEPYALQSNNFETVLVVEATITNELKLQQIKITRTFRLEEQQPAIETDAQVRVTDSDGNNYTFEEQDGIYTSTTPFAAIAGKTYSLSITTSDGKNYNSSPETLTTVTPIQEVTASVITNNEGVRGVEIRANSYDPANTSKYYRYEYEETFKIVAPNWSESDLVLVPPATPGPYSTYDVELVPRPDLNTRICYATQNSNQIIAETTSAQGEDRADFPVRFIDDQSYIISHRYSILVRQYVESLAAYTFYRTLKEISDEGGSVLSPNQPGFFYGNIKAADNPNEKVIGFFEVASVSSKRLFFNYLDLFPGESLPPYAIDCDGVVYNFCFSAFTPDCSGLALINGLLTNTLSYYSGVSPYFNMVAPPCSDCTLLGSNVVPPFWE